MIERVSVLTILFMWPVQIVQLVLTDLAGLFAHRVHNTCVSGSLKPIHDTMALLASSALLR